jgi:hypothetical protein
LADLLLLFIKLLSLAGCEFFKPDSEEVNLNARGRTIFVGVGDISDNEPPGLLSTFTIVGVPSVVLGMA